MRFNNRSAFAGLFILALMPIVSAVLHETVGIDRWYRMGELIVPSPVIRQPAEILYVNGGPVKDFLGEYAVTVRSQPLNGIVCEARGGPFLYRTDSTRPDPLTMAWWAPSDPRCVNLPDGDFILETCWTVLKPFGGFVDEITECITSDPFRVQSKE